MIPEMEALLQGLSPEAQAAVIGGIAGGVAGGVFTLLGVLFGLFGERWVRRWGRVHCDTHWRVQRTKFRPDDALVLERRLDILFLNRKDVDVTVVEMRVEFYKGGKPFDEERAPTVEFVDERDETKPLSSVNLPSRKPVPLTIRVAYEKDNVFRLGALEEADRARFVARLDGARDKRKELRPPWRIT